jgi:hypothetical protein
MVRSVGAVCDKKITNNFCKQKIKADYKGRQSAKLSTETSRTPLGGLGAKLHAMYEFHRRYGVKPQRGHGRLDNAAVSL